MRPHYGNHHPDGGSTGLSRAANRVDWGLVDEHADLVDYVSALVRLRVAHPAFHGRTGATLSWHTADWRGAIGYRYAGTPGDHDFLVLINYSDEARQFPIGNVPGPSTWFVMLWSWDRTPSES